MAEFSKLVITGKGQALISKVLTGSEGITFTKISTSDTVYELDQLEGKVELEGIKQTSKISKVTRSNDVSVMVEAAFTNTELTEGYYMRTLGLYAVDPDEGEILYALTVETSGNCFMPPYNGLTVSGAYIKLVTSIGNADNVSLEVDQAAVATLGNIEELEEKIADLKGFIGYTDEDIFGVEVDFENMTFTRLAGAVNRKPGADFDDVKCFGGRRRCNVTDGGGVTAYCGDADYTTTGIHKGPINGIPMIGDTPVQVMVEQPKFYYKVIPLKADKINEGNGYHLRKVRYYVSDINKPGFKLHPAFIQNGKEKERIYLSAYESCLWDEVNKVYILDNKTVENYDTYKLSSIGGAVPLSKTTRSQIRKAAANRGNGWSQSYIATVCATQILMLIEYASFNMQSEIGFGAPFNTCEKTGLTDTLGNISGSVINENEIQFVSYRGEENLWGNSKCWIDGINMFYPSLIEIGRSGYNNIYIADYEFKDGSKDGYNYIGFQASLADGYISSFGYSEKYDWLFIPSETVGNSNLPVGDYYLLLKGNADWGVILTSGGINTENGPFYFCLDKFLYIDMGGAGNPYTGGRLVYVPQN